MRPTRFAGWQAAGCCALLAGLALAGCGTGSGTTGTSAATTRPSAPQVTAVAASKPVPRAGQEHIRILSPAPGAHTGSSVVLRIAITPGPAGLPAAVRYILDGGRPLRGHERLTLHDLAPGRHHLVVRIAGVGGARAQRVFVVNAPTSVPAPGGVVPTPAPVASTPAPRPAPTVTATPRPAVTATPKPAVTASPKPASPSGIPQGPTAGDRDGDNNGGPSDGDGNI